MKILKHILPWQMLIIIPYLFVIIINYSNLYNFLLSFLPVLFLTFKIYYDKSKYIFILYRKLAANIKNPTVYWESSTYYTLGEAIDFKDKMQSYIDTLRINNHNLKNIQLKDKGLKFNVDGTQIEIFYSEIDSEISFLYTNKISYRNSINEFNDKFYRLLELLKNLTANQNDNFLYRVELKFDNFNPFYSLYVKNYADIEVSDFNINYEVNKLDIKVHKENMIIQSADRSEISNALKNYLIISN